MIVVAVVVYNRIENIEHWIHCWKLCDTEDARLVIIQNQTDNPLLNKQFKNLCNSNGIDYVARKNRGFDIGAFQDVCRGRIDLKEWDELLWCADDCFPMSRDFIKQFKSKATAGLVVAMEISPYVRMHIRTTGFLIDKKTAQGLKFPADPVLTKQHCYLFEHKAPSNHFLAQVKAIQVAPNETSPMWDVGYRKRLDRLAEHNKTFLDPVDKICIVTVFDKHYKQAGKTLFNSIKRHTDCTNIDFKVITSDIDILNELGEENCHFVTEDIKARYGNVEYSEELPVEKYASSWYRYEIFNMTEYNRVICIDSDCICVKDISFLFSKELNEYDLISVEDHIVSKCFYKLVPELERQGLRLSNLTKRMTEGKIDIQPALLVANKSIIKQTWYKKLLNYANTTSFSYSIDEGILNDFIYMEDLKIKLLPLEWDYQDIYEQVCPGLPVPSDPVIVHCQESKPFKKSKNEIDKRMHKWHDLWWKESKPIKKTFVVIIVWNRFENLKLWVNAWNQCDKMDAELIVIHNLESDNNKYSQLCKDNGITYIPRKNKGFDIGAFQDVCKERLINFPNNWDNLIWVTDDCIPMQKNFVKQYLDKLKDGYIPCYEISDLVKRHIRTTGFLITKEMSKKLIFPKDEIENREDCYEFEHKSKNGFFEQVIGMGKKPVMIANDLKLSPLWDFGVRGYLELMGKHEQVFSPVKSNGHATIINSVLDTLAIKHKSDKSSKFHNYAAKYDKILLPFRESFLSILEIGVAQGQSIKMWADYFIKATIHAADISKASEICEQYSNRIKFHLIDQSNEAQLKNLEQFSPFDLIIDDGNHFWREQILTFKTIFRYLRSGGIYIVEDSSTSYWKEYKNNPVSPVEFFKTLIDDIHLKGARGSIPMSPPPEFGDWHKGWHRREDCHKSLPLFDSIQFMNGFIVIYKR